jgi:hypothetical protein
MPVSYASVMALAIATSRDHRASLRDIYAYFDKYQGRLSLMNNPNWQHSVRHVLSSQQSFVKVHADGSRASNSEKNCLWTIDEVLLPLPSRVTMRQARQLLEGRQPGARGPGASATASAHARRRGAAAGDDKDDATLEDSDASGEESSTRPPTPETANFLQLVLVEETVHDNIRLPPPPGPADVARATRVRKEKSLAGTKSKGRSGRAAAKNEPGQSAKRPASNKAAVRQGGGRGPRAGSQDAAPEDEAGDATNATHYALLSGSVDDFEDSAPPAKQAALGTSLSWSTPAAASSSGGGASASMGSVAPAGWPGLNHFTSGNASNVQRELADGVHAYERPTAAAADDQSSSQSFLTLLRVSAAPFAVALLGQVLARMEEAAVPRDAAFLLLMQLPHIEQIVPTHELSPEQLGVVRWAASVVEREARDISERVSQYLCSSATAAAATAAAAAAAVRVPGPPAPAEAEVAANRLNGNGNIGLGGGGGPSAAYSMASSGPQSDVAQGRSSTENQSRRRGQDQGQENSNNTQQRQSQPPSVDQLMAHYASYGQQAQMSTRVAASRITPVTASLPPDHGTHGQGSFFSATATGATIPMAGFSSVNMFDPRTTPSQASAMPMPSGVQLNNAAATGQTSPYGLSSQVFMQPYLAQQDPSAQYDGPRHDFFSPNGTHAYFQSNI